MNTTKKKIISSGVAILCCIVLLIGTTFAWFTDSVKVSNNKIQAGTLDVELLMYDGTDYAEVGEDPIFSCEQMEPGHSEVAALKIKNNGTLALKYKFDIVAADSSSTGLEEYIDVYYYEGGKATEDTANGITSNYKKIGTLAEVMKNGITPENNVITAEDGLQYCIIALKMSEAIENCDESIEIQGMYTSAFDIVLSATQADYEKDGFGSDQYDAKAEYTVVETSEQLIAVMTDDTVVNVTLMDDLTIETSGLNISSDKNINLNDNNLTITKSLKISNGADVKITDGTMTYDNSSAYIDVRLGESKSKSTQDYTSDLVYENVTFVNSYSQDCAMDMFKYTPSYGKELLNVTFTNCTFENTKVSFSPINSGGAMNAIFDGCVFNAVIKTGYGNNLIYMKNTTNMLDSTLTIKDCTFNVTSNDAKVYVIGAQGTYGHERFTVDIQGSNVLNGTVKGYSYNAPCCRFIDNLVNVTGSENITCTGDAELIYPKN